MSDLTAVVVVVTLAVVLWSAIAFWRAHKRIEALKRGDWCDCEVCAVARARLTALFNDTPKGDS